MINPIVPHVLILSMFHSHKHCHKPFSYMCPIKTSKHILSAHVVCRFSTFEVNIGLCPTSHKKSLLLSALRTIVPCMEMIEINYCM